MFISKPNVTIGAIIFFICLLGLTSEGTIGMRLNLTLANILSGIGAFFVYLAGIFVGLIVFFDTSVDELLAILAGIMNIGGKLVPGKTTDYFKKKPSPLENKKMVIKGMQEKMRCQETLKLIRLRRLLTLRKMSRLFPISWL
jgi:S-DNA-T family DNA segregation ATPase FtsK/SpoIIIE